MKAAGLGVSPSMMAAALLVLLLLLAVLGHTNSQCMTTVQCGCRESAGCCLVVEENLPPISVVGVNDMITVAGNPNPQYGLTDNPDGTFSINGSGFIFTQRTLNREQERSDFADSCFTLSVSVDGMLQTGSLVLIKVSDVNDNPPMFNESSYRITVPEQTVDQPNFECTQEIMERLRAEDLDEGDNAMINYSVEGDFDFVIMDSSMPCVTPNFVLDRDTPPTSYLFTLIASNVAPPNFSARTTVTYALQDLNDNSPAFDNISYAISTREDTVQMSPIFQFRARDIDLGSNGEDSLMYSIRGGEGTIFAVNATSGILELIGEVDAEEEDSYTFEVVARDGGSPGLVGTATVVVSITDINELAMFDFQNEVHEITENQMETPLSFISIDDRDVQPSNNNNSIEVIGGDGKFVASFLELANGYSLQQVMGVDFEQNRTIQIILRTMEFGDPFLTQDYIYNITVLDVNDNRPGLMRTLFTLKEEDSDSQFIVNLTQHVFDDDSGANGLVGEYELVSVRNSTTDLTGNFTLNSNTGVLTKGNTRIDREMLGNSLDYRVNITDMGEPPLSQTVDFTVIILDINDNSPVFQPSSYNFTLEENLPMLTRVGTVMATDSDHMRNGIVIYFIVEEDSDSQFEINERTGEVSSLAEFNRETRDSYQIIVGAHDEGTPQQTAEAVAIVMITIDDVNDENPMFMQRQPSFNIDTSTRPGSEVGTVSATDQDLTPFNEIEYVLETNPSFFSIGRSSGVITLQSSLTSAGTFQLNISAFNPDREELKDTITATVSVSEAQALPLPVVTGASGGAAFLLLLIVIVFLIIVCVYCRSRRFSSQYNMKEISDSLNNKQQQPPILKMPVVNNNQQGRSRVTFKESVQETHYIQQSVVLDTDNTVQKESITKFDNSPQAHHQFGAGAEEGISPNDDDRSSKDLPTVVELETSLDSHMMNGGLASVHHMHGSYNHGPHSPIVHVVNGGMREEVDYSQNTSSDGHTYLDDEESMFSDDASIVNASIVNTNLSRYSSSNLDPRYHTPPGHPHLELHLPLMTHGQPTSSSLAQLQAHNLKQLEEAKRQQQYAGSLHNTTSEHEHSLTLTPRDHLQHASISTQSSHSPHSPPGHGHSHMATSASSSSNHHLHSGGRNYAHPHPHPLVMPDAFPGDTTDTHRFPIGSYADYGDASTYASADLDEALGFNLEAEPGIISLTATDYEDTEL